MDDLTKDERFLLEWLSKEDSSAHGECDGPALNMLVALGLAVIDHCDRPGYGRVALTKAGFAKVREGSDAPRTQG